MTSGYTAQQIRAVERPHLDAGVPLMRRAAVAVEREVLALVAVAVDELDEGRVLVLVGAGSNGGDALFAGAALARAGVTVTIVRTADRIHEEGRAAAIAAGALIAEDLEPDEIAALVDDADVIVDGILGTGTSGALRPAALEIVRGVIAARRSGASARVVAVDLPSGVDPDTGAVAGADAVLAADVTVTFVGMKAGLVVEPGRSLAGRIVLDDLGIGADLADVDPAVTDSA